MEQPSKNIRIKDYSYELPGDRIAKYPLSDRDMSKLLVWDGKAISDSVFRTLPSFIDHKSLLVFNNTKVIRARLKFIKDTGAAIEIFCLEPHEPFDFALNLSSYGPVEWKCLIGNLKRWKSGILEAAICRDGKEGSLMAEKLHASGDSFIVRFTWKGVNATFAEILESSGHMPIPPYLGRNDEECDVSSYQTTYASINGSVAAPTAGLHFTPSLLSDLDAAGIDRAEVTLHVSAGTFRPVKSELICDHLMHTEHFFVSRETLNRIRDRKITAVGTTTVRTLESLYWLGVSCAKGKWLNNGIPSVSQWEPYEENIDTDPDAAIENLLAYMDRTDAKILEAKTDILIVPGYRFRFVNNLITNFHQPRSTLLLLVAAFTGPVWKEIYDHALASGYRFLSYGDSMLLMPGK